MESTGVPRVAVSSVLPYDDVRKSVSHLKEILEEFCKEKIEQLSGQGTVTETADFRKNTFCNNVEETGV